MTTYSRLVCARVCAMAGALLLALAMPSPGQQVTGQWDFNNGDLSPTVGVAGAYWVRPPRDVAVETQFGTTASLGIPDIGGEVAWVMGFPANEPNMGYALYPEMDANGGGRYVNQYTVIMDILYPASSTGYRCLFQTNECNGNDGDFFINSSNGIGISNNYSGQVTPDVWHRVAFTFDLAKAATGGPTLVKYIDGTKVGEQNVGDLDGRWALYTKADNLPALLFADEDGETGVGYVNSIQVRNYAMTDAEIAALGVASAAGISGGTGVTGQWDFENADMTATVGRDLEFFKGCNPTAGTCEQDLAAATQFGPARDFGLPDINEVSPTVMRFPATYPCTGYLFPHGVAPNGGSALQRANQYTVIMDVYFSSTEVAAQAQITDPPFDNTWIALYQGNPRNLEDALLWINAENGELGDNGEYSGTTGSCPLDTWLRIACVVDTTNDTMDKYVNGAFLASQGAGAVDGERALWTASGPLGVDFLLLFADNNYETKPGYVSSIQVRDYAMTKEEVAALGGPTAAGIGFQDPPTHRKAPDTNQDGYVDQVDLDEFVACMTGPRLPIPADKDLLCKNFDVDHDDDIDQGDFGVFQQYYTGIFTCAPNCYYP